MLTSDVIPFLSHNPSHPTSHQQTHADTTSHTTAVYCPPSPPLTPELAHWISPPQKDLLTKRGQPLCPPSKGTLLT